MTSTRTDTAHNLLDKQLTAAYKARNAVDAWDIHVTDTVSKFNEFKGALAAANVAYSVHYKQPIPDSEGGASSYYENAYGRDYHDFENWSGKGIIARFTVAMDEIVKYVERNAN